MNSWLIHLSQSMIFMNSCVILLNYSWVWKLTLTLENLITLPAILFMNIQHCLRSGRTRFSYRSWIRCKVPLHIKIVLCICHSAKKNFWSAMGAGDHYQVGDIIKEIFCHSKVIYTHSDTFTTLEIKTAQFACNLNAFAFRDFQVNWLVRIIVKMTLILFIYYVRVLI